MPNNELPWWWWCSCYVSGGPCPSKSDAEEAAKDHARIHNGGFYNAGTTVEVYQ